MKVRSLIITLIALIMATGCRSANPITITTPETPPKDSVELGSILKASKSPEPSQTPLPTPTESDSDNIPVATDSEQSAPSTEKSQPPSEPKSESQPTAAAVVPTLAPTTLPPTPQPASVPFAVTPANPQPGEPLTLSWNLSPAESGHCVALTSYSSPDLVDMPVKSWCDLPDSGSMTISVPTVNRDRFRIYLDGGKQILEVHLPCPDSYFFNVPASGDDMSGQLARQTCPDSPVSVNAVEQSFDNGRMLWLNNKIYLLLATGSEYQYLQTFDAMAATGDPSPEPPPGKFLPDTVFQAVWQTQTLWSGQAVQEALGWATAPAQSFESLTQRPWQTKFTLDGSGNIVNASGPYSVFQYIRLANGQAVFLSIYAGHGMSPYWRYVNP